jgi:hypothetical protein
VPTERAVQQILVKKPYGHPATNWDVGNWIGAVGNHEVVMRTRNLPVDKKGMGKDGSRELYAVVSPSYKPYDIDAAANDLKEACPGDSRARVRYDGARTRVDIILQNPYMLAGETVAAVGETHRMVLRMTTSDDGTQGYKLSLLAERVRCINLTLLHTKKHLFKATHRVDNLREMAQDALAAGKDLMEKFAATWSEGWHEYYSDKHSKELITGAEALRRIVGLDKFRIQGMSEAGTLNAVLAALDKEPGDSKVHVHNALTRAAHEATVSWSSRWADDDAEVQASELLYQTVSWLPEVENYA